jgi:hypothetical protein
VEWELKQETEVLGEIPAQRLFVHRKSDMLSPGTETGLQRLEASCQPPEIWHSPKTLDCRGHVMSSRRMRRELKVRRNILWSSLGKFYCRFCTVPACAYNTETNSNNRWSQSLHLNKESLEILKPQCQVQRRELRRRTRGMWLKRNTNGPRFS